MKMGLPAKLIRCITAIAKVSQTLPQIPCNVSTLPRYRLHVRFSTNALKATASETSSLTAPALDNGLTLTQSCIKRLHEITTTAEPYLRVTISGGGCSGFQYEFAMDSTAGPDDKLIGDENGKALLVVDTTSLSYITGSTVDYYEELIRTGFRIISNPQADGGCSCGTSFSIKL